MTLLHHALQATSLSVPELVKQHFVSIFAGILPLHLGSSKGVQKRAAVALQVSMLTLADITEDERDELIQKQMVKFLPKFILMVLESVY